ncbi:MAG: hypothetical protein H7X89_14345 [Rhizobiales bacterium]|nr:hypothetical protein [Hyphomicrobiales bacterium]
MEQPRLLFVTSAAFNNITGGGITFSNLFRGWPQDRLFTVHNDPVPVSFDVCRNFYRMGTAEIGRWPHLTAGVPGQVERAGSTDAGLVPARQRSNVLPAIRNLLVGAPWPDRARLTPELERYIEQARPQLIYTILGTVGMTEMVCRIRDRFALPVAVHFMDDFAATFYGGGLLSPILRARMKRLLADVVGKAQVRLAIGDAMAAEYQGRWQQPFTAIQNAVEVDAIAAADPQRDPAAPMRLGYIGSIFSYAQAQSLADIAQSVARLASGGRDITLDIFSPLHLAEPFRASLEIHPAVQLHDTISDDATFFAKLSELSVLVLPVNFDAASVAYIRYSMPTKVPAYLASGTPILAYGPAETAQIAYAASEGWGLVVNHRAPGLLDQAIVALQTDNGLRARLSSRARAIASRHDVRHVRGKFQALLAQVVDK